MFKHLKSAKKRVITVSLLAVLSAVLITCGAACSAGGGSGSGGGNGGNTASLFHPVENYYEVGRVTETKFTPSQIEENNYVAYDNAVASTSIVGYSGRQIGTVERDVPTKVLDEGLQSGYPKYGTTLRSVIGTGAEQVAQRNALIREANYLAATGTANAGGGGGYTWMDAQGNLYSGTVAEPVPALDMLGKPRKLYKHSASVGLYLGNVADDEEGIIKTVTMRPRGYSGYGVTGVYAPAGEVIKIQISEKDMEATGGLTIHIGQALYNGQANNIWSSKNQMQRIPVLLNTMNVNKSTATLQDGVYTAYVGSFIGGPLYIRNTNATFTATISGGVAYPHFILGYTTKEEFEHNLQSSAPYFDLEVWNYGVLHSGPKVYASSFSYDDLYKAAVLWEKVAAVTTTKSNQGIVFLYDPFVAAGAAVAFPGRRSVNCPAGWMTSSLNYNAIVTSGSWGNFHEYHHNFQGYGVGNGGEVTNNGMTLVSYALFTKISSARSIGNFGAQGLSGWNTYTSATWALEEVFKIARPDVNPGNGNQGLALYATLLHNFGADSYIKAKTTQTGGQNYNAYMKAWENVTHNNMTYYFKDILKGTGITDDASNDDYPMFVPVSSVYQTGRSYMYDGEKKYITTMQPYKITADQTFDIDLTRYTAPGGQYASGSIVMPEGFTYSVKSITQPENGTLTTVDNLHYKYTPNAANARSGKIIVTLAVTKDDGAFQVDDIDLVLEFEPSYETNKLVLERTTYTYTSTTMYADAQDAYESDFAGYEGEPVKTDNRNVSQNSNTDIWLYNDPDHSKYPDVAEEFLMQSNTVVVIDGKLYFGETGKYRVYLRGRLNCALYFSLDGEAYTLGATIKDKSVPTNSAYFRPNDANTYFDIEFKEIVGSSNKEYIVTGEKIDGEISGTITGERWLYIKEVLIVEPIGTVASYVGVGMKQWTEPQYTMVDKFYDKNGNELKSTDANGNPLELSQIAGYDHTVTYYYDNAGNEVDAETVANAKYIAPTVTNKSQPYINAYRNNYIFPDNSSYESEYFYVREYNYNYTGNPVEFSTWDSGVSIVDCNKTSWDGTTAIENILTEGQDTFFHSGRNATSASGAMVLTLDMGKVINANSVTFLGRTGSGITTATSHQGLPRAFSLAISNDGVNFTEAGSYTNNVGSAYSATVNLNKTLEFRYIRITITTTHSNNKHFILSGIKFTYSFTLTGNGNNYFAPSDEMFTYSGEWGGVQTQSSFGHVYKGEAGSKVSFAFEGTRLAILCSNAYEKNYEVWIDGQKVNSIDVKEDTSGYKVDYISEKLSSGTHNVEIRCTGEATIDAIATYNETAA